MKPYLAQVIQNMLNGDVSALRDEMLKNNAEAVRKVIQQMVSSFDTMEQLAGKISDFMTVIALRQRPAAAAGDEVYDAFRAFWQQVDPPQATRWETFKDMAPKVFGAVLYAAGAAFIIYQLVTGQGINPIEGISLGLLSTALIIKSIEKLMALGLGSWLQRVLANGQGEVRTFASKLASWFTEGGIQAEILGDESIRQELGGILRQDGSARRWRSSVSRFPPGCSPMRSRPGTCPTSSSSR